MKPIVRVFAVVSVTVGPTYTLVQPTPAAQVGPESTILRRAAANIRIVEPAWRFIPAICNCPPISDEQVGVAAGSWDNPAADRSASSISVRVHSMANAQAASQWVDRAKHGNVQADWTVAAYDLGDGAYVATYRDGLRYEVNFCKGRFLGFVSGERKVDVERFARYVLGAMLDQSPVLPVRLGESVSTAWSIGNSFQATDSDCFSTRTQHRDNVATVVTW